MNKSYWFGLDQTVSPLGFGCWQLSGEYFINGKAYGWGKISENEAIFLIHCALDNGIVFFDTAMSYGLGKSEEILGEAIRTSSQKESAIICTKIPLSSHEIENATIGIDFSSKLEDSLKRLKRDYIDILLIHSPPSSIDWNQFDIKPILELQREGKIRTFGISATTIESAERAIENEFGTCLEWVFNISERRPMQSLFKKMKEKNMNFIARSPLARGLLTSKHFYKEPSYSNKDFRSSLPKDWIEWIISSMKNMELSNEEMNNFTEYALRYCINFEGVSVIIPGIKNKKHLNNYLQLKNEKDISEFTQKVAKKVDICYPKWR